MRAAARFLHARNNAARKSIGLGYVAHSDIGLSNSARSIDQSSATSGLFAEADRFEPEVDRFLGPANGEILQTDKLYDARILHFFETALANFPRLQRVVQRNFIARERSARVPAVVIELYERALRSAFRRFCVSGLFALRDLCGIWLLAVEDGCNVRDRAWRRNEAGSHHAASAFDRCFLFFILRRGGRGLGCTNSLFFLDHTGAHRRGRLLPAFLEHVAAAAHAGLNDRAPHALAAGFDDFFMGRGLCRQGAGNKAREKGGCRILVSDHHPIPSGNSRN